MSQNMMSSLHSLAAQELNDAQTEIAREAVARWRASQLSRRSHTPVNFAHNGRGGVPSVAGNGAGSHAGTSAPVNAQAPATVGQGSSIP